ncbi:MAG: ribulose-5-phosphate 4-epimerase/fuculose-1-phosphate aldolase [Octadecabacter sp.]|jgi:ribulose-5-phosphate 4-epimerase/fuculose-1-phosphate aldolase
MNQLKPNNKTNTAHWPERIDLAAALRWTARLDMHEAVANHFSLAVNNDGTKFLMNLDQEHFNETKASDLLLLEANDPQTLVQPNAPDLTAWGLHGSLHRHVPQARCVIHTHSIHATVLAYIADSHLPPIDQNTATFYGHH